MGKIIFYVVSIAIILLIGSAIRPYWNKYWITSDLETVALYGTKHDIEKTQKLLDEKIEDRGIDFEPEDLNLEKDENQTVTISLSYRDKISLFGVVLKDLDFTVDVTEENTKEVM